MFIAVSRWVHKYGRYVLAAALLFLVPSFVMLFAPGSGSGVTRERDVPTIRGKPVKAAEFQTARDVVYAQYVELAVRTGRRLQHTAEFQRQLDQEAAAHLLVMRQARELGIRVSEEQISAAIRDRFTGPFGQVDRDVQRRFMIELNNHRVTETQYAAFIRHQLVMERLFELVTGGIQMTPLAVQNYYAPLNERYVIEYVTLNAADFKDAVAVTEEEAREFYQRNPARFREPEKVRVRYVLFATQEARAAVTVTDEEVAQYYERNRARYTDAETGPLPLEEVRDEIRETLTRQRAERLAADRATEFTVQLVAEPGQPRPDFSEVAAAAGRVPQVSEFFAQDAPPEGLRVGREFANAAFALKLRPEELGRFSDPVRGEDGYYVLEFVEQREARVPPFEEVKDRVVEAAVQSRAEQEARRVAGERLGLVREAIAAGNTFAEAAESLGLSVQAPEPFSRVSGGAEIPNAQLVRVSVQRVAVNQLSGLLYTATGAMFFFVKEQLPPDPEQFEQQKHFYASELRDRKRQAVWNQWINELMIREQVNFPARAPAAPEPAAAG
jgi:peptidyl-prolyl cis-trans isomerase D